VFGRPNVDRRGRSVTGPFAERRRKRLRKARGLAFEIPWYSGYTGEDAWPLGFRRLLRGRGNQIINQAFGILQPGRGCRQYSWFPSQRVIPRGWRPIRAARREKVSPRIVKTRAVHSPGCPGSPFSAVARQRLTGGWSGAFNAGPSCRRGSRVVVGYCRKLERRARELPPPGRGRS